MGDIFESTVNTRPVLENSLKYIRSDVPESVSEKERKWLLENGITTIVDLRTEEERLRKSCPLAEDNRFHYHCMAVTGGNAVPTSVENVSKSYIGMADARLFHTIQFLLHAESNILYFCNAGKDRTGVVSAVLLYKLGMSPDYIVADYMKSKENLKEMLAVFSKQNPSVDIAVITPRESYIREFLEWLAEHEKR